MVTRLPRVVLAAPASGQGKTTVSVGVMAALAARGLQVAPAKVGPDFIDPGYHALATGRVGRNLDPWLVGPERVAPMLVHGAMTPAPADVAVIEGVMGLFDGRLGTEGFASSAHVATLTHSPVVLVADISSSSRSVAASIHGLRTFDPQLDVAGVVLNKAGSERHAGEVRRACERIGVPVLGVLPRDAGVSVPSRHLGLVPADERDAARATLDRLAERTAAHIDLDALLEIASGAPDLADEPWSPAPMSAAPTTAGRNAPVVAVAGGRAFTFRYAETLEMMRARGLEPVVFDPVRDRALPAGTRALYLGGGFPEVHARSLAANTSLLAQLRDAVTSGLPTVAECAGMLYLLEAVDGHRFSGVLPATAAMSPRLTLGYREAEAPVDTLLADAGTRVRGHEFHRTLTTPAAGDGEGGGHAAWLLDAGADGFSAAHRAGSEPTVHASYLHTHWAGYPELADRFAAATHRAAGLGLVSTPVPSLPRPRVDARADAALPGGATPGDEHHGDAEVGDGLVDFAVNVRASTPPANLRHALRGVLDEAAHYPDARTATDAVAAHHRLAREQVLLTNGAAEAFTLIARALAPRAPVVVHPQFSEPDAALRRAGCPARAHVLDVRSGAHLGDADVAALDGADLVVLGNPTNPTGVLHPRAQLEKLRGSGRVLVVDEAFMDLVPGESESLIGGDMTGVLVVRSLTKTWSIAGVRAGHVVGDAALIATLRAQQPHWSVNSLALEATRYAMTAPAARQVAEWAEETSQWREHLDRGLRSRGVPVLASAAPFVLARVGAGAHAAWRDAGFATRRADTFPGLDGSWVRLAVRDPLTTDALLTAFDAFRQSGEAAS